MTEFRVVSLLDAPLTTIREATAIIRGSPPKDIRRRAVADLERARKEISAFLDGLNASVNLVRIIPCAKDGSSTLKYITGEFRSILYDSRDDQLRVEYRDYQVERSAAKWKEETLAMEDVLQIQIWKVVRD